MTGKQRTAALTAAFVLLLAMVYSTFFIAVEINHECSGEDCPVCCQLAACENTVRSFSADAMTTVFAAAALFSFFFTFSDHEVCPFRNTLVSLKVKLSD